jgi:hypothetical protein
MSTTSGIGGSGSGNGSNGNNGGDANSQSMTLPEWITEIKNESDRLACNRPNIHQRRRQINIHSSHSRFSFSISLPVAVCVCRLIITYDVLASIIWLKHNSKRLMSIIEGLSRGVNDGIASYLATSKRTKQSSKGMSSSFHGRIKCADCQLMSQ